MAKRTQVSKAILIEDPIYPMQGKTNMISVLYVDDEPALLDLSKHFLEKGGLFSVDTAVSAPEALNAISVKQYDAIISDYQMPDMNGIEFLKLVRASGNSVPFIIFTGRGREEVVIQALNEGADFYLQKGGEPVSQFAELTHKICLAVQQRRAEVSIHNLERKEKEIIDFLPDATFAIDARGVVIAWNRAMEKMTGVKAEEILGKGDYEYAIPFYRERRPILIDLVLKDDPAVAARYPDITRSGDKMFSENVIPHLNNGKGASIWFTASPLFDTHGEITGAIESIRDITERKQIEQRYRNVVEDQTEFISRFLPDGTHVFVNEAYCRYFGLKREEILGHTFRPKIPPGDQERLKQFFISLTARNPHDTIEHPIIMPDGTLRWQRWSDRAIFDSTGTLVEYQSVGRDITEQKQAEIALQESEERYRSLVETTETGYVILDNVGRVITANQEYIRLTGRSALMDIKGRPVTDWTAPHDLERNAREIKECFRKGKVRGLEIDYQKPDGTIQPIEINASVLQSDSGPIILTLCRDITERRKVEESLKESESFNRGLVENLPEYIVVYGQDGKIIYVNNASERVIGYNGERLVGASILTFVSEKYHDIVTSRIADRIKGDEVPPYEIEILTRDGRRRLVIVRGTVIQYHNSPVILLVLIDITERKQIENSLRTSQTILTEAMDLAHLANWELNDRTGIFTFNDRFYALCGTSAEREGGYQMPADMYYSNFVHPDDLDRVTEEIRRSMKLSDPHHVLEHRIIRRDGEIRHIVVRVERTMDKDSHVIKIHGVNQDITELRQKEDLMQTTLHQLDSTIAHLHEGVIMVSEDGKVEHANQAFCDLYNLHDTPERLRGLTSDEIIKKIQDAYASPAGVPARIREFIARGKPVRDYEITLKNGRVFMIDYTPIIDAKGHRQGRVWHHHEITDRKKTEEALASANKKLKLLSW